MSADSSLRARRQPPREHPKQESRGLARKPRAMSVSSEVRRTLVKSPPELWAELSDPTALGRHLGELGEIRITGTDPERLVQLGGDGHGRDRSQWPGRDRTVRVGHPGHAVGESCGR